MALGFHPACVISAITYQDTKNVKGVYPLPPLCVKSQAEALFSDLKVVAVKVGMLWSKDNVEAVAELLDKHREAPLVVDPVVEAKEGEPLIEKEGIKVLTDKLLPLATVVTPNVKEAETLTGVKVRSEEDLKAALENLKELGVKNPVIKGWRRGEKVIDLLLHEGNIYMFKREAVEDVRGSGCTFSSAIAALLAKGYPLPEAVEEAGWFTWRAIRSSGPVGLGFKVIEPLKEIEKASAKLEALYEVRKGLRVLEESPELVKLIPEVRMNLVVGIPGAKEIDDVCGVEGRVTEVAGKPRAAGCPSFGASSHLARLVIEVMKHKPHLRAALNVKYSPETLEACRRLGFKLACFDRRMEPENVQSIEGRSLTWGVQEALKNFEGDPDAIYDEGGVGKEPMIRLLGRSALEVVKKARKIASELENIISK